MAPQTNSSVKPNLVVGLVYTLKNGDGKVLEARTEQDPLFYIHGYNQLLPAVEAALLGKVVGDATKLTVEPSKGYGEYQKSLVVSLERAAFPSDIQLKVGMRFDTEGPEGGPIVVEVVEIKGNQVTIDGNHPLAGETLAFDMKVHSLREATREELEHGHVHVEGQPHSKSEKDKLH